MKRVIIVQARMTSRRLPGKVLMDLAGRPMLAQQLRRLKCCRSADDIVVATTTNPADDPVVALADGEAVSWFRGSEDDVLSRYLYAARQSNADIVVRITADCPLIDPEETDRVIQELEKHPEDCDYAANILPRGLPQGLDTEALFRDTLERVSRLARSSPAREHVTLFIYRERPDLFVIRSVTNVENNSDLRWTVDTAEDLNLVRHIYEELALGERVLPYHEVVAYVRSHPVLASMNTVIGQELV